MEVATENRVGYKKTKLGWIPEDWDVCNLKEIVDSDRKIRYGIVQPGEFDPNGRYLLRGQDYSFSKGWNSPENLFKVSPQIEAKYIKARLKKGDLVITIVGAGTGFVAQIPEWLDGANITQTTARIAIDGSKADASFFQYYLNSDFGKKQTYRFIKGGAQPGLNVGDVEIFLVQTPPLREQQKIAAILSTWDKAIDTLNKLISEKEQLKKGLMQQLLTGKKRFAGFTDKWKEVKLGEVFSLSSGKTKPSNTIALANLKMNIPVYGGNGISGYTNEFSNSGDLILIGRVGEYCGAVHFVKENCWITDNCLWANNFSLDDGTLFFFYLLAELNLGRLRNKGGQPLVSQKPILNLKIAKPKLIEQQMIAAVLSAADKEIALLKQELTNLTDQKKGLIHKLLTGEMRVKISVE
jgi:type I restriction enzyme S subunit